ncbi:MAG: M48 family metallopeptidase [Legionella sp.]|nr:M48 family metallopeptidase [Legionella sp.]
MHIEIQGIPIQIIKKKIKSINLRVYPPDGLVKMTVPMSCTKAYIQTCLEAKLPWIQAKREHLVGSSASCKEAPLQTGSIIEFLGENYVLNVHVHNGPAQIKIHDQVMYCYIQTKASSDQTQLLIERWYKQEMYNILPNLIEQWESIIPVKVNRWVIKTMKSRWGSCNTKNACICLNLKLIKKPLKYLEYVLVHELVHLLEPSHNKRFYGLMSQYLPDWREYHMALKRG